MIFDNISFLTIWSCFCLLVTVWSFYGNNIELYGEWLDKIMDKSQYLMEIPIIGLPLWLIFYFFFGWIMKYLMMVIWMFTLFLGGRVYCGGWSSDCIEQSINLLFGFGLIFWFISKLVRF